MTSALIASRTSEAWSRICAQHKIRAKSPRKAGSAEPFDGFAFHLKPGEVQRFLLHVHTPYDGSESVDAYEWNGLLDLLIENKRRTIEINDNGEPFVLVNAHRYRDLWWMGGGWTDVHP